MARSSGRSPSHDTQHGSTGRGAGHPTTSRRERVTRPHHSDRWIVPLLLVLAAVVTLAFGYGKECLSLADNTPGMPAGQVCTSTMAPGAIVVAVLLVAAAVFIWLVQRRR